MRVFWLFNHPAPYKVAFWNCLGEKCDLTVYIERASEAGRNAIFYGAKPASFKAIVGKPLPIGGFNSWSREPIHYLSHAKEDFDVVVLNGWRTFTEMHAISYCKKHKIPYVFAINGGIEKEKEGSFSKKMKKRYIAGATAYLSPDPASNRYLLSYGAEASRIENFPYGSVDERELLKHAYTQRQKDVLRKKLGLVGERIFVSSGQLIERKNHEQLIRLWNKVPADYSLYIAGEGKLKDKLQSLIDELGLKNVFITEYLHREELLDYLKAADGFVLLSKEDIYGHVVVEALSQGAPVIASENMNAAKAWVKDGLTGEVVNLAEEDRILDAITHIDRYEPSECLKVAAKLTYQASGEFHLDFFRRFMEGKK